ncbi:MAG: hypothetical protein V4726_15785 [Verrucomicrobiota bacterium]
MSLARKGLRRITVNGDRFRWRVAPDDEPGMAIVVESETPHGQRMVTWVEHGNIISPWLVRFAILNALQSGWRYDQPGPELILRLEGMRRREEFG